MDNNNIKKKYRFITKTPLKKIITFLNIAGLVFLLIIFFTPKKSLLSFHEKQHLEELLQVCNQEERAAVRKLFKHCFFYSPVAFTLFGSKPVSIHHVHPMEVSEAQVKAWKKLSTVLSKDRFCMRDLYSREHFHFILVAQWEALKKVYKENQEIFLTRNITLDDLWDTFQGKTDLFERLWRNDHLLLGILFGFGTRNAQLFTARQQHKEKLPCPLKGFCKTHPIFYVLDPVIKPFFVCDPNHPETHELKQRYDQDRKKILAMAKHDDLFDLMLATCF